MVGVILYVFELRHRKRHPQMPVLESEAPTAATGEQDTDPQQETASQQDGTDSQCCGMHLVCEKDTLIPLSDEIEYYDDEELDRFIGRDGTDYTPEEVEEFQDVLLTLRPEDVVGWARSITLRRLELPPMVRDSLLLLVNEQRQH